jgi:hypothetical protein
VFDLDKAFHALEELDSQGRQALKLADKFWEEVEVPGKAPGLPRVDGCTTDSIHEPVTSTPGMTRAVCRRYPGTRSPPVADLRPHPRTPTSRLVAFAANRKG